MVLYARGDILSFHNPANGHDHLRPFKQGTEDRVQIWGLACAECALALQGDPSWSPSRYKIPMSPDEEQEAEDAKAAAEAAMRQQQIFLAQSAVTAQLAARNAEPQIDPEEIAISSEPDVVPRDVEGDSSPSTPSPGAEDYAGVSKPDLKELCRDRGLSVSGTRDDLIARLAGE